MLSILSLVNNKYVWLLLVLAALLGGAYYGGYVRGNKPYIQLQAQDKEQDKERAAQVAAIAAQNAKEKKAIEDESQAQITLMANAISDLSVRYNEGLTTLRVCTSTSSSQPSQPAIGSTTSAGPSSTPANEESIAIAPAVLNDTLDTAIAAINAELEWRKYARSTGQVQ